MKKVFGLDEARRLAERDGDVSCPTVIATLDILGVPNVVGQQVADLVALHQKAIQDTMDAEIKRRDRDAKDEQVTTQKINNLQTARDDRAKENAVASAVSKGAANALLATVKDLQALAKKFA